MNDDEYTNGLDCATGRWLRAMADIEHDDGWQVLADNERMEAEDGNE